MTTATLFAILTSYCLGTIIGGSICTKDYMYTVLGTLALAGFILYQIMA